MDSDARKNVAKVRIRRVASRTRWQLVTFCGKSGGESVGVVDLLAIRKDHGKPVGGIKELRDRLKSHHFVLSLHREYQNKQNH